MGQQNQSQPNQSQQVPPKPSITQSPTAINAWSPDYLEAQHVAYKADPDSIPPELRSFFQGFDLATSTNAISPQSPQTQDQSSQLQARTDALIAVYRSLGHAAAQLDPFNRERPRPEHLCLESCNLNESDLDLTVDATAIGLSAQTPLRTVHQTLERTYCGPIGAEVMHVQDREERTWLLERIERNGGRIDLDRGLRAHILEQLTRSESFERFLAKRYPGEKRFSLEGAESLIPLMDRLLEELSNLGSDEVVLGMAHRGRLNVLNNVMGKTYQQIFTEFEDNWDEDFVDGGGDVKYHRGYSSTRTLGNGKTVHLVMSSNPSHLEAVGPVVLGRCRAKQRLRGDKSRTLITPILIHGDAAIAGQGIVAETLNMSQLEGYTTGGCIHVVVNNMIGFTTLPEDSRSSMYCTDVAKMIEAPVLHVNGEDPEAVITAAKVAAEYRQHFRKDVFIDMYCYRRYGHNEQDETSFTQPILAGLIKRKPSVLKVYAERLLAAEVITEADLEVIRKRLDDALDQAQQAAKQTPKDPTINPGSNKWKGLDAHWDFDPVHTAVPMPVLKEVCAALGRTPEGFNVNSKLQRLLKDRAALPDTKNISFADAESLAYGTLLLEGFAVRLSGQDCRRGTFSHRHAVLRDSDTGQAHVPLNHIGTLGDLGSDTPPGSQTPDGQIRQARLCVYDSPLSEASVLGFEYGYSLADPKMLVLWEAQFGDFANGAQTITDQFIAPAEAKWQRWSALTMLLPHGYEGAGPEHSSSRVERFLQLAGDYNLQVCYPSTASQVFHMLRRQVKRSFRKPLIVLTPKSMLRTHTSTIDELSTGSFQEFLDDPKFATGKQTGKDVTRVIYCTGKLAHELLARRDARNDNHIAIIRVEQLYPFHNELAREINARYPKVAERLWVQEEPRNMGAYLYISDRFRTAAGFDPTYIGRDQAASPAVGSKSMHKIQQHDIITKAVGPAPEEDPQAIMNKNKDTTSSAKVSN